VRCIAYRGYYSAMTHLTPRQIVAELDQYIIGQGDAKKAVAVAVRNRWRRQQLPLEIRRDVSPKNILMIGPTGVGKTEIARRLAGLTGAPFIKVEATKYTEVGYVGRDVESMVRDLLEVAIRLVQVQQAEQVRTKATDAADERLIDLLMPLDAPADDPEAAERHQRSRDKLRQQLAGGSLDDATVEVTTHDKPATGNLLGMMGMDQMDAMGGGGLSDMFDRIMPGKLSPLLSRTPKITASSSSTKSTRSLPPRAKTAPTFRAAACSVICCQLSKARPSPPSMVPCAPITFSSSLPAHFTMPRFPTSCRNCRADFRFALR
jgi:ATP-dependent protease HslVU (ClpYQ) ATPase subunit